MQEIVGITIYSSFYFGLFRDTFPPTGSFESLRSLRKGYPSNSDIVEREGGAEAERQRRKKDLFRWRAIVGLVQFSILFW